MPETVVGSVLAAEDDNFYEHKGVNLRSIGRAVDANLDSGSVSQGGSTITQQVVKNSLVGNEQDLSRKIREAFLAVELEKQMTRSSAQAGRRTRAARARTRSSSATSTASTSAAAPTACRPRRSTTSTRTSSDLNWAEGALLAALIRSPSTTTRSRTPKLASERRRHRVQAAARHQAAHRRTRWRSTSRCRCPPSPTSRCRRSDYFVEEVKQQLLDDPRFGLGATAGRPQPGRVRGRHPGVHHLRPGHAGQGHPGPQRDAADNKGDGTFDVTNPKDGSLTFGTQAIASVEPNTGAVRAMVGGPGFDRYQFNLATHLPGRQPGSSMKTVRARRPVRERLRPDRHRERQHAARSSDPARPRAPRR